MGIPTKVPINLVNPTPAASTDLSDYVDLTSAQTISGAKAFTDYGKYILADNTSETQFMGIRVYDSNNKVLAAFRGKHYSNGTRTSQLGVFGLNSESGVIECSVNSSGTVYTSAPTPDTSDNSTKIATTAFVNNRLPYETGTWTPTLSGGTTAGEFTYSYTGGGKGCYYVKFGNLVFLRAAFTYTVTTVPSGEVRLSGCPFVSNSYYKGVGGGNTRIWHLAQIGLNTNVIRFQSYKSDLSGANISAWGSSDTLTTWNNAVNSSDWIIFSIWFQTT